MTLKELRRNKGLTQKDLADRIGVQSSIISRYENGILKPTATKLQAMADALGVNSSDFIIFDLASNHNKHTITINFIPENDATHIPNYEFYRKMLILLAKGRCELCHQNAPFLDKDGLPFLEIFMVENDDIGEEYQKKLVALCPNCFKKLTVLQDSEDILAVTKIAEKHI